MDFLSFGGIGSLDLFTGNGVKRMRLRSLQLVTCDA